MGSRACRLPQQVAAKQLSGCDGAVRQLSTDGEAACLRKGTGEYAAQVLPIPSDVSAAGYKSLTRSPAKVLLTPELSRTRAKRRLQSCRRWRRRRRQRKQRKKNLQLDAGPQNPGHRLRTFTGRAVADTPTPLRPQVLSAAQVFIFAIAGRRNSSCKWQQVQKGRGSPASWNCDPWNFFLFSSPTQERRCLQIEELKCFLKLESGGIQSHRGHAAHLEAFISVPISYLQGKSSVQKQPTASRLG